MAWDMVLGFHDGRSRSRNDRAAVRPRQFRGPPEPLPIPPRPPKFPTTTTTTLTIPLLAPSTVLPPSPPSTPPSPPPSSPSPPLASPEPSSAPESTTSSPTPLSSLVPSESLTTSADPSQTPGDGLWTDTMSPSTPLATSPTTTNGSGNGGSSVGAGDSDMSSNRTLVITLSSVLGSVALLLIAGAILICWRYRRGRGIFFTRGISPIDDDEIATWKVPRDEKTGLPVDTDVEADGGAAAALNKEMGGPSHTKQASTSSIRKPPSVIVYPNAHGQGGYRHSTDEGSPRSFSQGYQSYYGGAGRMSLDKALPQTPIQARAPNAREGLTDESIPGDEPFIASPRRQPSRLSKLPPGMPYSQRRMHGHHSRTRSSRSSTRSFAGYGSGIGSDMDLAPGRHSHDQVHMRQYHHSHSRVYSTSSIPPRLSLGDESFGGPLASPRTMFRDHGIGRAIG